MKWLKASFTTIGRMQFVAVFQEQISMTPKDMKQEIASIDDLLERKFATKIENKCSRNGFVLPNTLKILSRSMGYIEKGRFTGNILFHIQAEAGVLNPPDGAEMEGDVMRKNKMGMYVNYNDAIRIILPRDLHIGNEEFEAVQVGDRVRLEVKKSRFQVNDAYILSVGIFRGRVKTGEFAVVPEAERAEEDLEDAEAEENAEEAEENADDAEEAEQEELDDLVEEEQSDLAETAEEEEGATE
jgi:DNA-directed RNA polymerase subunit E'/Rpb7